VKTEGLEGGWRLAACDDASGSDRQCKAPGGMVESTWRCVMPARRSGPSFRLMTCDTHQADLVQCRCARNGFYTALGDVHDTRLWLGVQ